MPALKKSELTKLADQAGISVGGSDASAYPTIAQLRTFAEAVKKLEQTRCAALCRGLREAASHSSNGLKKVGAMSMAESCAALIEST